MRLIDADAAKKAVHEEFDECLVWDESGEYTANVIEEILESLPTVEAEPVTRCKDCKWYSANTGYHWGRCENYRPFPFDETDYCSRAERKEE